MEFPTGGDLWVSRKEDLLIEFDKLIQRRAERHLLEDGVLSVRRWRLSVRRTYGAAISAACLPVFFARWWMEKQQIRTGRCRNRLFELSAFFETSPLDSPVFLACQPHEERSDLSGILME